MAMTTKDAALKWGISDRRVRVLCAEGKIDGVWRDGKIWYIPDATIKPNDGRFKNSEILMKEISRKKLELDHCDSLTEGEIERLAREFVVEFTYNSNAIEGNTLTLKETALALEGITVDKKPLKDHLDAVGHRDAILYAKEVAKETEFISEQIIKNIHSLVLMNRPEDRGMYRRIPVRILGAYTEPVQPHLIEQKIQDLLELNKSRKESMNAIERVALFHLEFEEIHPFIDGNGRTGRLVLNLELIQEGYPPINIKFADRKQYYDAFDSFYRDRDASKMINLIARYIDKRLDEYLAVF